MQVALEREDGTPWHEAQRSSARPQAPHCTYVPTLVVAAPWGGSCIGHVKLIFCIAELDASRIRALRSRFRAAVPKAYAAAVAGGAPAVDSSNFVILRADRHGCTAAPAEPVLAALQGARLALREQARAEDAVVAVGQLQYQAGIAVPPPEVVPYMLYNQSMHDAKIALERSGLSLTKARELAQAAAPPQACSVQTATTDDVLRRSPADEAAIRVLHRKNCKSCRPVVAAGKGVGRDHTAQGAALQCDGGITCDALRDAVRAAGGDVSACRRRTRAVQRSASRAWRKRQTAPHKANATRGRAACTSAMRWT